LNGNSPGEAFRPSPPLFPNQQESCFDNLIPAVWAEQPEISHGVTVAFWNMLRPSVDEVLNRKRHGLSSAEALVLVPEPDESIRDRYDPSFCDWRPPYVASGVTQNMLFSVEGLHVNSPIPNLLVLKQTFDLVMTHF
jgi:hypothetical protein